jgi:hypothetical protein
MVLGRNVSSEAKSTRAESAAFAVELPKEWARRASSLGQVERSGRGGAFR